MAAASAAAAAKYSLDVQNMKQRQPHHHHQHHQINRHTSLSDPSSHSVELAVPRHRQPAPPREERQKHRQGSGGLKPMKLQFYKTKMCPWGGTFGAPDVQATAACCRKGVHCQYAHSLAELRPLPDLSRTKLCERLERTGFCPDRKNCTYAHTPEELRATDSFAKTKLCPQWQSQGICDAGSSCRFAHGLAELRKRPQQTATAYRRGSLGSCATTENQQHEHRVAALMTGGRYSKRDVGRPQMAGSAWNDEPGPLQMSLNGNSWGSLETTTAQQQQQQQQYSPVYPAPAFQPSIAQLSTAGAHFHTGMIPYMYTSGQPVATAPSLDHRLAAVPPQPLGSPWSLLEDYQRIAAAAAGLQPALQSSQQQRPQSPAQPQNMLLLCPPSADAADFMIPTLPAFAVAYSPQNSGGDMSPQLAALLPAGIFSPLTRNDSGGGRLFFPSNSWVACSSGEHQTAAMAPTLSPVHLHEQPHNLAMPFFAPTNNDDVYVDPDQDRGPGGRDGLLPDGTTTVSTVSRSSSRSSSRDDCLTKASSAEILQRIGGQQNDASHKRGEDGDELMSCDGISQRGGSSRRPSIADPFCSGGGCGSISD